MAPVTAAARPVEPMSGQYSVDSRDQKRIPKALQGDCPALETALNIDGERKRFYWLFVIYNVVAPILFVGLLYKFFPAPD